MRSKQSLTVLISSVGRRSQLIDCFRKSFKELGVEGRVLGIDLDPDHAPAAHLVNECFPVPECNDPGYLGEVLRLCIEHQVDLVIPTIDTELIAYAAARRAFEDRGIDIVVSSPAAVEIACDKVLTHDFLIMNGIPTVCQIGADAACGCLENWKFPLIVKPRRGSASRGVVKVDCEGALQLALRNGQGLIVQEFARGFECTVNVFADASGRCICAVPHRRIEVRGGEVSKAVTIRDQRVIRLARNVAEALPGARGPLNVQCFVDRERVMVTEINARFGGGYPLSFEAGANFPLWLLQQRLHQELPAWHDTWKVDLTMLRYDAAVFI